MEAPHSAEPPLLPLLLNRQMYGDRFRRELGGHPLLEVPPAERLVRQVVRDVGDEKVLDGTRALLPRSLDEDGALPRVLGPVSVLRVVLADQAVFGAAGDAKVDVLDRDRGLEDHRSRLAQASADDLGNCLAVEAAGDFGGNRLHHSTDRPHGQLLATVLNSIRSSTNRVGGRAGLR